MRFLDKLKKWFKYYGRGLLTSEKAINELKILTAKLLIARQVDRGVMSELKDAEFKVFSQFGEDGIIQYLIRQAGVTPSERIFVEFGAELYREANTRFLSVNDNWRGLLIDGSESNIASIRNHPAFWMWDLTAVAAFITAENINATIAAQNFQGDIGLLSIDIDGMDYWVWERIDVIRPVVVVVEYNSVFGRDRAVTVPYDPDFTRRRAHHSDLYFGCSLRSLELLSQRKGYVLVGSNSAGNNAFFVRSDRLKNLQPVSASQAYVESRFRESVDHDGRLTYVAGSARRKLIADMPLIDVERGIEIRVGDIEI